MLRWNTMRWYDHFSYGHADFIEKEAERLAELIKKDVKRDNAIWKIGNMEQGIAQLKQQVLPIRRRTLFYENGTPQVALKTVFTKPSPLGGCQRRITELRTKGDNHGVQNHTRRVWLVLSTESKFVNNSAICIWATWSQCRMFANLAGPERNKLIPSSQLPDSKILISAIHRHPDTPDLDYVKLTNNNSKVAVDISGANIR